MLKRIMISLLMMTGVSYGAAEEDHVGMARRIREAFEKHEHLLNASKGRDIVAFLGNTGAGKSTLVNILAGIRVIAQGPDYVLEDTTDGRAMAIGEGGDSQTVYPQYIDVEGTRFFDLPGFNDTDGSEQNLVNAAFIYQILKKARTIRPVFVVGEDEFISQRGESIKRLFTSMHRLTEEAFLKEGLLVVTKSAFGNRFSTLGEYVAYLLKKVHSERKPEFTERMNEWMRGNRLRYMSRPGEGLEGQRDHVLGMIKRMAPRRMGRVNISAIYPEETLLRLEGIFYEMMGETFRRGIEHPLTTLSTILGRIGYYGEGYWGRFEEEALTVAPSLKLLREFSGDPYARALERIESEKEEERRGHIDQLEEQRKSREDLIKRKAVQLTEERLRGSPPRATVPFDFRYYNTLYDDVTGRLIRGFTEDPIEEEMMRLRVREYMVAMDSLKETFREVMREHFSQGLGRVALTMGEIDREGERYASPAFWEAFRESLGVSNPSLESLRDFFKDPYTQTLVIFEREHEEERKRHIRALGERRGERGRHLEREAIRLTEEALGRHVPRQRNGRALMIDFGYHKDIYDEVVGRLIEGITRDPIEVERMRTSTADYISRRSEQKIEEVMERRLKRIEEALRLGPIEPGVVEEGESPPDWVSVGASGVAGSGSAMGEAPRIPPALSTIPPVAIGHEADYERFLNGILTYKPNKDNDRGRIDIPIRSLANPLEGTFDLSGFGDRGKYITISTGYKKAKIPANEDKVEIWLTPKFLVEAHLGGDAGWMSGVMDGWEATYGILWTWGGDDVGRDNFDCLLRGDLLLDKSKNLYEKWSHAWHYHHSSQHDYNVLPSRLPLTHTERLCRGLHKFIFRI